MKHIEHIGIAVKSIENNLSIFEDILGVTAYKEELVDSEGVRTAFIKIGESKIELLEATKDSSPIAKFLEKRGEGIHHLAFSVPDIEKEMTKLKGKGYRFLNETPKDGADNKIIAFMHPKDSSGVLIELCQEKPKED